MAERVKQPAAEKAAAKKEAKLRVEIGRQPTTVNEWMKGKIKLPSLFKLTAEGDLIAPPFQTGDQEKIIYLPPEEHTTVDEIKEHFITRATELKAPEEIYASAKKRLREVIMNYKAGRQTVHDVVDANNEVHQAECILTRKAKGNRFIKEYEALMERELTMNTYDVRKFPIQTYQIEYDMYPLGMFWKKAAPAGNQIDLQAPAPIPAPSGPSGPSGIRTADAARTGAIIARRKISAKVPV